MTKNNIKTVIFGALIVAMILPFSGMPSATAERATEMITEEKYLSMQEKGLELKTTIALNETPKMLSEQDISILAPQYLELESKRNTIVDSKTTFSTTEQKTLSDVESQMTSILKRVQEHKESAKIKNHIPEKDKLKMELAVQEILESDIPFVQLGVSTQFKAVRVGIQGPETLATYETQIRELLSVDVPLSLYEGVPAKTATCTNQQGVVCDPVVGGIQIEWANDECTLSLFVKEGWWSWANEGWLTAGHCYPVGAVGVDQPSGNNDIGDVTNRDYTNNGDCDCEFIDKTTSRSTPSQIWLSSNTYKTITGKSDAVVDDWIIVSWSMTTGIDWGQVSEVNQIITDDNGKIINGVTYITGMPAPIGGDSGSPIADLFGGDYHGVLNGEVLNQSTPTTYYSPWSNVQSSLGVY